MTTQAVVPTSLMVCAGCGAVAADPDEPGSRAPYPFQCPNAGGDQDVEHVLVHALHAGSMAFPTEYEPNPFVRYRHLSHAYQFARAHGMPDERFVAIVRTLDHAIGRLDGSGFVVTPCARHAGLGERVGQRAVWVKDETVNVSGSHKARHLMGIMIYLQVLDALGFRRSPEPRLAIASCGNAALAAAVVAAAARRPLDVFIPPDAPSSIVTRLTQLGACVIVCQRSADTPGDPCYLRFKDAVRAGGIPFCCQGPANAMTIEGGKTLGYEMIAALGGTALDALVVQVGGGALASSLIQAFADGVALHAAPKLPRLYAVQTTGAYPLERAFGRLVRRIGRGSAGVVDRELRYALLHRREFMWPWEKTPRSIARGILDDETYDWFAIVKGMLETGGRPVVVDDSVLEDGFVTARLGTGVNADHTGTAGLAGLLQLQRDGAISRSETVAVVFSGVQRP